MKQICTIESMAQMELAQKHIIEVLDVRFQLVPEHLVELIQQINNLEQLDILHRQAITINSLSEFQKLIESLEMEESNEEDFYF